MIKSFKVFKILFLTIILTMSFAAAAFAGKAKIEFGDPTTTRGKNFELTLKVKAEDVRLKSADITISYDNEKITFNNGTKGTVAEGGAGTVRVTGTNNGVNTKTLVYTLSFNAVKSGQTNVTILNNTVMDTNENIVNIIHEGKSTITIKPASNTSKNANLKSLTISPGELDMEFNPDNFTYSAMVNFDVDKLIISAPAEDNDAVVSITGNENFAPGNNSVQIVVTAPNGTTKKTYTINVNKSEIGYSLGETVVVSGEILVSKEFSVRVLTLPEEDSSRFSGYSKITPHVQNLNINGDFISAYAPTLQSDEVSDYFIFYGVETASQSQGYFRYDTINNTIQRYIIEVNNQNISNENSNNDNDESIEDLRGKFQLLLYLLIASLVIIVILIIVILLRNSGNRDDKDFMDDDGDDDDYFQSDINRRKNVKSQSKYEEDEDDEIEELI